MSACRGVGQVGEQQEKPGWQSCAGVGGLVGWLGDGMKARDLWCLWKKRVKHMPIKSGSFYFLALMLGLLCHTELGARLCGSGCAEARACASGLQCDCSRQHLSSPQCPHFRRQF